MPCRRRPGRARPVVDVHVAVGVLAELRRSGHRKVIQASRHQRRPDGAIDHAPKPTLRRLPCRRVRAHRARRDGAIRRCRPDGRTVAARSPRTARSPRRRPRRRPCRSPSHRAQPRVGERVDEGDARAGDEDGDELAGFEDRQAVEGGVVERRGMDGRGAGAEVDLDDFPRVGIPGPGAIGIDHRRIGRDISRGIAAHDDTSIVGDPTVEALLHEGHRLRRRRLDRQPERAGSVKGEGRRRDRRRLQPNGLCVRVGGSIDRQRCRLGADDHGEPQRSNERDSNDPARARPFTAPSAGRRSVRPAGTGRVRSRRPRRAAACVAGAGRRSAARRRRRSSSPPPADR
jgi:hypothetical protein